MCAPQRSQSTDYFFLAGSLSGHLWVHTSSPTFTKAVALEGNEQPLGGTNIFAERSSKLQNVPILSAQVLARRPVACV